MSLGRLDPCVFLLVAILSVTAALADSPVPDPETAGTDYQIGIEDVLRVSVWGEPELTVTVNVRPDGKITVPLVNDLYVVGKTPEQVARAATEKLTKFVRDPNVTVIVEEINSFRIYILGEVNSQGVYNFYRPTRLLQALAVAGGLTPFSKKDITLIRQTGRTEKRIQLNYKGIVSGERTDDNVFLKPGDTLLVD